MKISKYLALGLLAISLTLVFGQQPPSTFSQRVAAVEATEKEAAAAKAPPLTKFNLDFPGGTPAELVAAVEKAMNKPLNAIIPDEFANEQLPPLKMNNVNVPQLFQALQLASVKPVQYVTSTGFGGFGGSSYSTFMSGYGFKTEGPETDDSVWYFFEDNPPKLSPEKTCRFYQLSPYLDRGLTVDDITTAIQTGWKMEGETSPPEISFHKETKLLIAVGEPDKLEVINNVLQALQPSQDPADLVRSRLNEVRNQELQSHAPQLPNSGASSLSPEEQVILMEAARLNSLQSTNRISPTPAQPQRLPLKPEAGQ